jgi:Tol biopolymer transport system component
VEWPVNFTADHDGFDRSPAWSPDGSQIAFVSERDGGGIFLIPAIGGLPVKVSASNMGLANPVWSADGTELAYIIVEPETVIEIVSQSTRKVRRLTMPGAPGNRWDLSWSRDGRFFAYGQGTGREFTQLWVLRASDGQAFAVTDGASSDTCPMWSRDGRTIFFLSSRGGSMDLWQRRIAEDGEPQGDAAPLTVGVGIQYAALTLDGQKIAYSQGRSIANVWRIPILEDRHAGWADAEQLTFDQAEIRYLDLSPDGEQLIVDSDRGGAQDLWVVPLVGNEMRQVTSGRWAGPLVARRRADRLHVQQKWKSGHMDRARGRRAVPSVDRSPRAGFDSFMVPRRTGDCISRSPDGSVRDIRHACRRR